MINFDKIKSQLSNISGGVFWGLYLAIILIVCLLYCFHGIDMTDSGWVLTGYQQILKHPHSVESMFYIYDTLLLGGIWEYCFGFLGIIGYKILAALFHLALGAIVYLLLREVINRWIILLGIILLIIGSRYLVFHYDLVSAFFSLFVTFFILQSLKYRSILLIFLAGVILGISVFVRFPNIALCGLILVLVPFYIKEQNLQLTIKLLISAVGGLFIGVFINLLLILALGHWDCMINMCKITFSFLSSSDSTHNLPDMLCSYISSYLHVLKFMYPLVFYPFLFYFTGKSDLRKWVRILLLVIFCLISIIVYYKSYMKSIGFIHAFCCTTFMLVLYESKSYKASTIYLASSAFLILLLFPLGSDGGLFNVRNHCLFLSFPLALGIIWNRISNNDTIIYKFTRLSMIGTLCLCFIASFYQSLHNSYRDTGSVLKKTAIVKQANMLTTYTNPNKAEILDDLLTHIKPYVNAETELLAYPSIPIINYLTDTKPYLNGAWVGILNLATFESELINAEKTKSLPIIIIVKAPDIAWFIPNNQWLSINDCEDWHPAIHEKNQLLCSFIQRHSYNVTYNNELFQVLIPNNITKK